MGVKPFAPKRIVEELKYEFTAIELRELGDNLAQEYREAIRIENNQKRVMAEFTAAKKATAERCADLSLKIQNRYEYREFECIVQFCLPAPGRKTISRADTGKFVREDQMTPEEMQAAFEYGDDDTSKPQ